MKTNMPPGAMNNYLSAPGWTADSQNGVAQCAPQPPIDGALASITDGLFTMGDRIAQLEHRVGGVLRPVPPSAGDAKGQEVGQLSSPVVGSLRKHREHIDMLLGRLEDVLGRLEC